LVPVEKSICGQAAAPFVASKVPSEELSLTGGLSRRDPVGGSAKGMPSNFSVVVPDVPTMMPDEMVTVARLDLSFRAGDGPPLPCTGVAGKAETVFPRANTRKARRKDFISGTGSGTKNE
jgi:hypothetical protein